MLGRVFLVFLAYCAIAHSRSTIVKRAAMPPVCESHTYCFERSKDYPEELIEKMIIQLDPKLVEGANTVGNRQGYDRPDDDCERNINFDPIYEIVDVDDNVRFVVQSETTFLQKIRTESCIKPGRIEESMFFMNHDLTNMNLSCEEKRIEYWFLVLSLDGTKFETVRVKGDLPVCCSCRLKKLKK